MTDRNVAIIGSGIAGIATSIRLAVKGHKVSVFEANDYPGGKLSEFNLGPYRFDAGPSLFTMPELVEELYRISGEIVTDHFQYERLATTCHYFYPDGTVIKTPADENALVQEIHNQTGEPKKNLSKALRNSRTLFQYLGEMFMFQSIHDYKTFISKKAFSAYANIWKMDFFRTMNKANKSFFQEEKVVQMFNRYATYNGSDPYQTPATMNIIPHLEFQKGAFFPKGGMYNITKKLVELAERKGVKFYYNSPVKAITIDDRQVKGIKVGDAIKEFDRVISNMDIVNTYRKLLPDVDQPEFLLKQPKSSSALIFYWGIKKDFPGLDLHNIFFSGDYKTEFEYIFRKGEIYRDPTVYVNISSKFNPMDAPEGCENWFTMVNVPNNSGQDWDKLIAEARENIIRKLSEMLKIDIGSLIEEEEILDPRLIESKTSSAQGALYGNSSNNIFAAFLRHSNFSRRIKGLYFCGGSVHPGGGIPMALSSAKIVDQYFR